MAFHVKDLMITVMPSASDGRAPECGPKSCFECTRIQCSYHTNGFVERNEQVSLADLMSSELLVLRAELRERDRLAYAAG